MSTQTLLERRGLLFQHPLAELTAEILAARLPGSLRLSSGDRRSIIYFNSGRLVYAVSNAKRFKLFDRLISKKRLTASDLRLAPNAANDLELSAFLKSCGMLTKEECDELFREQITDIVVDALGWDDGQWEFSSLARIRDGLEFEIAADELLANYSRCLSDEVILSRFRSLDEQFSRSAKSDLNFELAPEEAFVLSRSMDGPLTIESILNIAPLTNAKALHIIYTLWLSGLLIRSDWQRVFDEESVVAIKNAKLELKREAKFFRSAAASHHSDETVTEATPAPANAEPEISLEEYLQRVENATTFYDILGVDRSADTDVLKRSYFSLAKRFHPDKYRTEAPETVRRIQEAFTSLSQAHEMLKNPEQREIYNYRMRKEIAEREERGEETVGNASLKSDQASENFERGFTMLMDGDAEGAVQFLARAAHYSPNNARYRAYYGKALASDEKQRHKAEAEMQAALRLDKTNPTYRLMLAEFFADVGLMKRAEGELNRLLAIYPSNQRALEMLEELRSRAK